MIKIDDIQYVNEPSEINGVVVENDANEALAMIKKGREVARYEFGESMMPILKSGEYCILRPLLGNQEANIGDAVFCEVDGYLMTHMVIMKSNSAKNHKPYYLIGDTSYTNVFGWTDKVYATAHGTNVIQNFNDDV